MRNSVLVTALLTALGLPIAIAAQSKDETDVRTVVAAFGKALASGDSSAALALLHADVVIFEGGGWETLEDYRKGHQGIG